MMLENILADFELLDDCSFSFRVVSDQSLIGSGVASVRRKLARL